MPDERKESAIAFLKAALASYKSLGITVARVMIDNGACYKAFAFRDACRALSLKHIRTKPYTPKTNGKSLPRRKPRPNASHSDRPARVGLRYAQAYPTSDHRAAVLPLWLHRYNWHRPHGSLKSQTPIGRLGLAEDNLLRLHS